MNADLLRQARIRKASYMGAVLVLFYISLVWRGVIGLPMTDAAATAEKERRGETLTLADKLSGYTLLAQAETLDLRELNQDDPDVATSAATYALVGIRGPITTALWWQAIEKQKRNEWHELQQLVDLVTYLQPNFITPWIFQSWNISYNVSVENEKLSDMFYYISQGISLLVRGDRVNTKDYTPRGEVPVKVGSPDIRFHIAFFYQNKFSVSDKVITLRSLMQLSAMPPADRDPDYYLLNGQVDEQRFRQFCASHPQLVRRLRTSLNCSTPKDVIDFLRSNSTLPTRYKPNGELLTDGTQFPIFPPMKALGPNNVEEYLPDCKTTDTYDAFHAARAWFDYSSVVVPPPPPGEPATAPRRGEYDEFRYRIPQRPALIIFRTQSPRAQHYLADRLSKEGWFTADTVWEPDAATDVPWFPRPEDPALARDFQPMRLKAKDSSQAQWRLAHEMWLAFGELNGVTEKTLARYSLDSYARAYFRSGELPRPAREYSNEELDALVPPTDLNVSTEARRQQARELITAHRAVVLYNQNLSMTNYRYFLDVSQAEATPVMLTARQLQWEAEQALRGGEANRPKALRLFAESLALWHEACKASPAFHGHDGVQEKMFEIENTIATELKREVTLPGLAALVPAIDAESKAADYIQNWAEDAAAKRVAAVSEQPLLSQRVVEQARLISGALAGGWSAAVTTVRLEARLRDRLLDGEYAWMKRFTSPDMSVPWIRPSVRESSKIRLGMNKPVVPSGQQPQPASLRTP